MLTEGVHVLDGSDIRTALPNIKAKDLFVENDEGSKGYLTTSEVRKAAEAEAAALLLGARNSSQILDNAFLQFPTQDFANGEEEAFISALQSYLTAISDALEDEPVVVSVLDGSAIKMLLEDEEDFVMVAETYLRNWTLMKVAS